MYKLKSGYNVPGIPPAPRIGRNTLLTVDYDFIGKKKKLAYRLPFFSKDEITRRKYPYYVILLHEMMAAGHFKAVQECYNLIREDTQELRAFSHRIGRRNSFEFAKPSIIDDRRKLEFIADTLCICYAEIDHGRYEIPTRKRKELGEMFLKDNQVWLAVYFFHGAAKTVTLMEKGPTRDRMEAEINCIMAFIVRETSHSLSSALEAAIQHLVIARTLAKGQSWQFKNKLLSIKLMKPIAFHGLRDDFVIVDGSSMPLYMIATLLEHEMLIGMAYEILKNYRTKGVTPEEMEQAHLFANNGLRLAHEVRHPVAICSALLRFGTVLRNTEAYQDAIQYFRQLVHYGEITGDEETVAIAYHNIALCEIGDNKLIDAIGNLIKQKQVADMFKLEELQADALLEIGIITLQEGDLWEAEECFASSYEGFVNAAEKNKVPEEHCHCEHSMAMFGIAAGHKLWSRLSGLIRSDRYDDLTSLLEWKNDRNQLLDVARPNYYPDAIDDVYPYLYSPDPYPPEIKTKTHSSVHLVSSTTSKGSERFRKAAVEFKVKSSGKIVEEEEETDLMDGHHDFASDYDVQRESMVQHHIKTQLQGGRSTLSHAMESRGTLMFPII